MRKSSLIVIDNAEAQALVEYIRNPHIAGHDESVQAVVDQFLSDIGTSTAREISIHTQEVREANDE